MMFWYIGAAVALLLGIYRLFMSPQSQVFGIYPYRIKTKEKIIALTFDDGPNEPYTTELADFLKVEGVKATFFQVGRHVMNNPKTTKRLYKDGHVIGNHTLSHRFRTNLTSLSFKKEIIPTQKIITKVIGKTPALYRSPWLWRQPWLFRTLKEQHLQAVSGKFGSDIEVFRPNPVRMANSALRRSRPGVILIFHDGIEGRGGDRSHTVAAVKLTVAELKKQGYRFVTIDELLEIPAYQ